MTELAVDLHGVRAGWLSDAGGGAMGFRYDTDYAATGAPPLSVSLPVREEPFGAECVPFFDWLLPEGPTRTTIARRAGTSEHNTFALLRAYGGECAGAVQIMSITDGPDERPQIEWLSDDEMAVRTSKLASRPFLVGDDDSLRLSLGGAQEKALVVVDGERVGVPHGGAPSTHIVKPPIASEPGSMVAELFAMRLAAACGIPVANVALRAFADQTVLMVERFDRETRAGIVGRLHHETFGQALGVRVLRKYQADGGPGPPDLVELLRSPASGIDVPARAVAGLFDLLVFNVIVGNTDAHVGNFGLLYDSAGHAQLSPAYDVLAVTAVLGRSARKLAMKVGGEYRVEAVALLHVERMADELGVSASGAARRTEQLAATVADCLGAVAHEVEGEARVTGVRGAPAVVRAAVEGARRRVARLLG